MFNKKINNLLINIFDICFNNFWTFDAALRSELIQTLASILNTF